MYRVSEVFSVASQQSNCGKMSDDLLANRKHLYEISGISCLCQKRDQRNLEADVTSNVNAVARIEIFVRKHSICHRQ